MKYSQSLVKRLESNCPRYVQAERDKEFTPDPNINLIYGNYFELQAIGATMTGAGAEIPLLKSGEKSANHQRIDHQVEKFKQMFDVHAHLFCGYVIEKVQAHILDGEQEGHIDIVMRKVSDDSIHLADLKLTGNLLGDFGSYGWGKLLPLDNEDIKYRNYTLEDLGELDLLQAPTYVDMWEKKFGHRPNFHYIVFDYSTDMNVAWFEIEISETFIEYKRIRFNRVIQSVEGYDDVWPTIPLHNSCRLCKLDCKDRLIAYGTKYNRIPI